MTKSYRNDGFLCLGIAVICFLATLHPQVRVTAHLLSLGITYFFLGAALVIRYFYCNLRGKREFYRERIEYELKREQAKKEEKGIGYYLEYVGMYTAAAFIFVFVLLEAFFECGVSEIVIPILGIALILQITADRVVSAVLSKKRR